MATGAMLAIIFMGSLLVTKPNNSSLTNVKSIAHPCPIKLPNDEIISISQSGAINLSPTLSLQNVLLVPQFQFNLLPISKLTIAFKCFVILFSNF